MNTVLFITKCDTEGYPTDVHCKHAIQPRHIWTRGHPQNAVYMKTILFLSWWWWSCFQMTVPWGNVRCCLRTNCLHYHNWSDWGEDKVPLYRDIVKLSTQLISTHHNQSKTWWWSKIYCSGTPNILFIWNDSQESSVWGHYLHVRNDTHFYKAVWLINIWEQIWSNTIFNLANGHYQMCETNLLSRDAKPHKYIYICNCCAWQTDKCCNSHSHMYQCFSTNGPCLNLCKSMRFTRDVKFSVVLLRFRLL